MAQSGITTLIVETASAEECPHEFLGDTADLVYFMSFAYSERYGSDHPLAKAAALLRRKRRIGLAPLLTFGDARTDDAEEERLLERLWQDAGPLAECARNVAGAIESNEELRELTEDFPELPDRLRELGAMADWAAERGAKVRLTYIL